ncbi:hypothetical protein AGMMS50276_16270 [Synergistales bacterium]|nr:hypothetical protein AGMMS50276_16270 [Synergistales bacterium]
MARSGMDRNPFSGIGKPEPLKGNLQGYWSRHIDEANRIIYKIENAQIDATVMIAVRVYLDDRHSGSYRKGVRHSFNLAFVNTLACV